MSFFLTSLKKNKMFRLFVLLVALSLPITPIMAVDFSGWLRENIMGEKPNKDEKKLTKEEKEQQKLTEQEALKKTAVHMLGDYAILQKIRANFCKIL